MPRPFVFRPNRRNVLGGLVGLAAPSIARAAAADTLRFAPISDLTGTDPFFNSSDITTHHVGLVFETLWAMDATLTPRPHLLEGHVVEEDGRLWRLTLRDGPRFHDGTPVRAEDAVASVRGWGAVDVFGRKVMSVIDAMTAKTDRQIDIRLRRPFPLLAHLARRPLHPARQLLPADRLPP